MRHGEEGPASSMRGRLSEVFMGALVGDSHEALLRRLGDRAALDEPVIGASSGPAQVRAHVQKLVAWCADHDARYERKGTIIGTAIDVTEGLLELRGGITLPVAVVIERRREREVVVRIHFPAKRAGVDRKGPTSVAPDDPALSGVVADAIARLGVAQGALAFEEHARVTDGGLGDHPFSEFAPGKSAIVATSLADDGRAAAVEISRGGVSSLVVLERGDSGLLKNVRLYWDD